MQKRQPYLIHSRSIFGSVQNDLATAKIHSTGKNISELFPLVEAKLIYLNQPPIVLAIVELLVYYGLRISDVLRFTPDDVCRDGSIKITQAKGSSILFCHPIKYRYVWLELAHCGNEFKIIYSRQYFYRLFLKCGFYAIYSGNINKSVTHNWRHLRALAVFGSERDFKNITAALGHNSKNSAFYYSKNQK